MANDGYTPLEQERESNTPRSLHEAADGRRAGPASGFDQMLAGRPQPMLPAAIVESLLVQKVNMLCAIAERADIVRIDALAEGAYAPDVAAKAETVLVNAMLALDECVTALRTPDAKGA